MTPLLKEALAMRGIRFDELETLDRYAHEIPARCQVLLELQATAVEATDRILDDAGSAATPAERIVALTATHSTIANRMIALMDELLNTLRDLTTFVPLWIRNLERRRALILHRQINENDQELTATLGLEREDHEDSRTADSPADTEPAARAS